MIEDGAKTLMALSNIIDTSRMKAPAFCMVLTGNWRFTVNSDKMKAPAFCMVLTGVGDFAYKRTDGVYVVPIGCLRS